jgi:hypothetical protein
MLLSSGTELGQILIDKGAKQGLRNGGFGSFLK